MKALYLLRHAKSSWSQPGLDDQQRPLNARGRENVPTMGRRFVNRHESVDLIISSPARRAFSTARLFAAECGYAVTDIETDEALYFLGRGSIENLLIAQASETQSLMLVFHNPDITHFANSLDYQCRIDNVPTCGLLRFECDIEQWSDWTPDSCRFDYFDFPKNNRGEVIRA